MSQPQQSSLLWWVIPGVLAGMPMPFLHPDRRMAGGGALSAFDDELLALHAAGVRAVVSLLNIPSDASVYKSAGFSFLCLPIPDGAAPTFEQADEFVHFVMQQRAAQRPIVVHCEAGLGRTGTILAAYLVTEGEIARAAIARVRAVEKVAIETTQQIRFLDQYEARIRRTDANNSLGCKCNWSEQFKVRKIAEVPKWFWWFLAVVALAAVIAALFVPIASRTPRRHHSHSN
jgi:hypothetical protein